MNAAPQPGMDAARSAAPGVSAKGRVWSGVARGLALFLGGFSLLNLVGQMLRARFDANLWWIDARAFPRPLADTWLLLSAIGLISYAVRPAVAGWRRLFTILVVATLGIGTLANTVVFYRLLLRGVLTTAIPLPLSLFLTAALGVILVDCVRAEPARPSAPLWQVALASLVCLVAFPIAQMVCFGKTDYRRAADVAVVFGARTFADGRPSDALADRVRTACQLYKEGLTRKLLLSGGPGDGAVHETEAMRTLAIQLGVAPDDIIVDAAGVNTQATVRNTEAIFKRIGATRILAVSHFYHLPRIKMAYQRDDWEVYTVPARESYTLRAMPFFMAREVAALWVYYLRPLRASPNPGPESSLFIIFHLRSGFASSSERLC